jgi:hypothetical protein
MILSLALALLATAGGALATYVYDEGASLLTRLCSGACIGLAAFGLIGFILASFLGLTPLAITIAAVAVAPTALLFKPTLRNQVQGDLGAALGAVRRAILYPSRETVGYFFYCAIATLLLWQIFNLAMFESPEGIYTGVRNNFGDLPFHVSVITGFAHGNNFPPEDPTYAGVRFTYPFLTDFISAMFVKCGASLRESMFIENFIVALAFVVVLHRWAWEMLRDRLAALLTPLLVLLNGGFGWLLLFSDIKNQKGVGGALGHLRSSFTIGDSGWRWGNAFSTLLVTQRGILLGLPLAVIVFTQWWVSANAEEGKGKKKGNSKKAKGKKEESKVPSSSSLFPFPFFLLPSTRRMIAAGFVAGLLPLVHAHSLVVVMAMGACLALLQRRWREWIVFGAVASLIALPQMWWSTRGSAVSASTFFGWEFGWDHGTENPVWFWFKNTGLFIPAIVAALLWRGKKPLVSRRLLLFYLPFTLCFIVPNVVKLAPWIWDNVKVLFYWWLASAPLVALLLSRLWHDGSIRRVLSIALLVCITLAGALDVAIIVSRSAEYKVFYRWFLDESKIEQFFLSGQYQVFDRNGLEFAELVKQKTLPRSLLVHAPVHNTPVFLTGRRSLMGYPGHIWTHGLQFAQREGEIRRIYSGAPDAESLIKNYGIQYAVVGPLERMAMPVNEQFFSRFEKVGEIGDYRLYKTQP